MRKFYNSPVMFLVEMSCNDVIATSGLSIGVEAIGHEKYGELVELI